jgi:hypothetical protein
MIAREERLTVTLLRNAREQLGFSSASRRKPASGLGQLEGQG